MSASSRDALALAGDTPDLSALIGSRICHDLISPLGAIGNGVELMALSGLDQSPEMMLIAESVESANARIRFFRVAFGAAGEDQAVGEAEISAILEGLARTGRQRVDWRVTGGGARLEVKLAFLAMLCLESAMPWGGTITVERTEGRWTLTGAADRLRIADGLWAALGEPGAALQVSSSEVEFPLTRLAAQRIGRPLGTEVTETSIRITF